jgi:predicted porin
MRKTQLALAAVALVASSAAMAQVSVYGGIDAAVVSSSAGTALAGAGNSGVSLIGFKGTEDLGGGLKAGFALETGYTAANGTLGNGGVLSTGTNGTANNNNVNALFNRQANISLSTENVGITLGTQISPFILAGLTGTTGVGGSGAYVPALLRLDGGNVATVMAGSAGTGGFFVQDAANVNFNAGGLSGNVMYRVRATSATDDGYTAANVATSVGGINLGLGYQSVDKSATGQDLRNIVLAGNTEVAGIRLNAAFSSNSGPTKSNGYIVGASMPLAGAISAGLTYAYNSKLDSKRQMTASVQYDLSKRTYAYLNYSSFSGAVNGGFASNDAGGLATAKSLLAVGVAHSF